MPAGGHQLCGSRQQNPSLYEHSLAGCFASMPGRGETKLLALDPAAHPYSTPSTVTLTLLGAAVPQQGILV